jgi:hypothetical protein
MSERLPRCAAKTTNGGNCRKAALRGQELCPVHASLAQGDGWGRPPTITGETIRRIASILRAGGYVETALGAAGVAAGTYEQWMRRGLSEAPGDVMYRELRREVELAKAEGEARNVAIIAKAAATNWQAAAWLLERQYPERWARVAPRELTTEKQETGEDGFAGVDELGARRRRQ